MDELIQVTQDTIKSIEDLLKEMEMIWQPRSNFALDHFVVGQHDLPARQREQVLAELNSLMFGLCDVQDELELAQIELEDAEMRLETDDDIRRATIEHRKLTRKIQSLRLYLVGRVRECNHLLGLLNNMPKYSREQYEKEEIEYWRRRLTRQAYLNARGDFGNFDALLQTLTIPGLPKPELPVKYQEILALAGLEQEQLHE